MSAAAVVTELKGDKQLEPESFALLNLLLDLLPGLAVTEPACCGDMKCSGSKVLKTEAHFVHMGQVPLLSAPHFTVFSPPHLADASPAVRCSFAT